MKFVRDLVPGDEICVAEMIDLTPFGELHRPVTITVKSCVRMRDNSGDYAVAAEDAVGRSWAERVAGDTEVNQPDDDVVQRLQRSFTEGVKRVQEQIESGILVHHALGKSILEELLHEHQPDPTSSDSES